LAKGRTLKIFFRDRGFIQCEILVGASETKWGYNPAEVFLENSEKIDLCGFSPEAEQRMEIYGILQWCVHGLRSENKLQPEVIRGRSIYCSQMTTSGQGFVFELPRVACWSVS